MSETGTALVVDNRAALRGRPGLHAFIAGVSDYCHLPAATRENRDDQSEPHYGLRRLASPALSAYRLARALQLWGPTLAAPIATVRLLLSGSSDERLSDKPLAQRALPAIWDNFAAEAKNWREDAATHKDNVSLFYFGGHGLQRYLNDQILLLNDFGDGKGAPLNHGVDSRRLLHGMATSSHFSNMARRQLFLFDACRTTPPVVLDREIGKVRDVWTIYETTKDDRNCAIFYAASPGELSYANRGNTTVFVRAFIKAVNGVGAEESTNYRAGGRATWTISATGLANALANLIKRDPSPFSQDQNIMPMGVRPDFVFRELGRAPRVEFTIRVSPASDHKRASLALKDCIGEPVCETGPPPIRPYPFVRVLNAGLYISELQLRADDGSVSPAQPRAILVHPLKNSVLLQLAP
jgi:Caspase domain